MTQRTSINTTADDYGMHPDINRGITYCIEHGLVDGIAAAPCGDFLSELPALAAAHPQLRIGAHLMLIEGRPLTTGRRLLVKEGRFTRDVFTLTRALAVGAVSPAQVEHEWDAQILRLLDMGIRLSHLNSHQHAHLLPGLWPAARRLARKYGIEWIRTSYESVAGAAVQGSAWLLGHQVLARRRYASLPRARRARTLGMLCSTRFTVEAVLDRLVREAAAGREAEIMVHPGFDTPEARRAFPHWSPHWEEEIAELKKLKPILAFLSENAPDSRDLRRLAAECRLLAGKAA